MAQQDPEEWVKNSKWLASLNLDRAVQEAVYNAWQRSRALDILGAHELRVALLGSRVESFFTYFNEAGVTRGTVQALIDAIKESPDIPSRGPLYGCWELLRYYKATADFSEPSGWPHLPAAAPHSSCGALPHSFDTSPSHSLSSGHGAAGSLWNEERPGLHPDTVLAVRFSVFNRYRARLALKERMLQGMLGGVVDRISAKEVKCLVVARLEDEEAFDAFLRYISIYAPRVNSRDEVEDKQASSVFDDPVFPLSNVYSTNNEAIDCLYGETVGVKVYKMSEGVRHEYEAISGSSLVSEDPEDAVDKPSI